MPIQYFFAKSETVTTGRGSTLERPAGVGLLSNSAKWTASQFQNGADKWFMIRIDADADQADLTLYSNHVDTRAIPQDIDQTVALAATVAVLDEIPIPSQWVNSGMTYRQVMRTVGTIFALAQRIFGATGLSLWEHLNSANLNTAWVDLPATFRIIMRSAADDLGMDYSDVQGTDTLKVAIWKTAQDWNEPLWGGVI